MVYTRISMVDAAQAARPHSVDGREVETKRAVPKGVSGKDYVVRCNVMCMDIHIVLTIAEETSRKLCCSMLL